MGEVKHFDMGSPYITRGVYEDTKKDSAFYRWVMECLTRHSKGDWGDVPVEDKVSNNEALEEGGRLLSAYTYENNVKIWIITEADRSATTILYPSEY